MKVLHICTYYIGSELYKNLISSIMEKKIHQEIYIPIRNKEHIGKNEIINNENTSFYYDDLLKKSDKLFYYVKMSKQYKSIMRNINDIAEVDFIHAHTLFSDGGTAFKLHRKYGKKYIVTIRNTDINIYFKYAFFLRPFIYKVLKHASSIVFISESYKQTMISLLPKNVLEQVEEKFKVIPNGIDNYWHDHRVIKKEKKQDDTIKIIFIGSINKNKNLESVIKSCIKLREKGYSSTLDVIGSGPLEQDMRRLVNENTLSEKVSFHGYLTDKDEISDIMEKCHIFVMPSHKETFGLTYIEAMSKGLPVIYTSKQGIDGLFKEGEVGYSVIPNDIEMISNKILNINSNYQEISTRCLEISKDFTWQNISKEFISLYQRKNEN